MKKLIISLLAVVLGVGLFGGVAMAAGDPEDNAEFVCGNTGGVWYNGTCMERQPYCENVLGLKWDSGAELCVNPDIQAGTLLPVNQSGVGFDDCKDMFNFMSKNPGVLRYFFSLGEGTFDFAGEKMSQNDVLACGIRTGNISLWMIPYYIKYIIQFALTIAGLIAVFSLVVGGYFYLFGGMSSDKDKGKNAIIYGLLGFVVAMLAWALVNVVISALTR
jgi:hypothetical protein